MAERRQRRVALGLTLAGLLLHACSAAGTPSIQPDMAGQTASPTDVTADSSQQPAPTAAPEEQATSAQAVALDFTAREVGGGTVHGAQSAGVPVVLWMWAPWCPACNREAPHVAEVARTIGDRVTFIGVAGHDDDAAHEAFVADHGLDHIVHAIDEDGSLWARYGVSYQPAWVFVDTDGTTRLHAGGLYDNLADWITDQIDG